MRGVAALAAAVLAAVVLSACGSSRHAPVSAPHVRVHGPGSIVFVAGGPSTGLGVNNTDLFAANPTGGIRDLTSSATTENSATWSADGSHVVFVSQSTTGRENGDVAFHMGVYTWAPGHGAPEQIASCTTYCSQRDFAWSPDDRQVAFVNDDAAIQVMNADGSGVRTVCDAPRCGQGLSMPMWSPVGRKLVFSNEGEAWAPFGPGPSGIWITNADGSGVEKLTQSHCNLAERDLGGCAFDAAPAWSPNGRLIAFSRQSSTPASRPVKPGLKVMRADGSHLHGLCRDCGPGNANLAYLPLAWAPDGRSIVSVGSKSFRITSLAGKTTRIRTCAGARCLYSAQPTWSPSGKQLTFFGGNGSVWVIDRDGAAMHRVAVGAQCCSLAWVGTVPGISAKAIPKTSAAGHLHLTGSIAYDQPAAGTHSPIDLLSLGTAGTHVLRVASIQGLEPSLSPGGRQIAFASRMAGKNTNIYVADRDGENLRTLTHFQGGAFQPTWSPDGRTIAFTIRRGSNGGIGLVSVADGHARRLTSDAANPSWNPNGHELLFDRRLGPQEGALFTINTDGSGLRQITNLPGEQRSSVWSPNGKEIAFKWWTFGGTGLYLIRPDGTHLHRVTTAAVPAGRPTWSPDSRYLAVISPYRGVTATPILIIDVKTGRVSTAGRVAAEASDPSWAPH